MGAPLWNVEKVVKKGDYLYAVVKEHPRATKHGYVLLHRIIMENHLGRLLNEDEVVHHKNGNKKDNELSNLSLTTYSEHASRHGSEKGHLVVILKCPFCGRIFERTKSETHLAKGGNITLCSRKCNGSFNRIRQLHKRTQWVQSAISENVVRIFKRFPDNSEETISQGSVETIRTPPEMVKK